MPTRGLIPLLLLALLAPLASAHFGFFEQMFSSSSSSSSSHGGGGHDHQRANPSDASIYHKNYLDSVCDRYLCPDTLACVHFPHHCPCAWDANEDKFELGDGRRICLSKGGFKAGEAARKVELARKGWL